MKKKDLFQIPLLISNGFKELRSLPGKDEERKDILGNGHIIQARKIELSPELVNNLVINERQLRFLGQSVAGQNCSLERLIWW